MEIGFGRPVVPLVNSQRLVVAVLEGLVRRSGGVRPVELGDVVLAEDRTPADGVGQARTERRAGHPDPRLHCVGERAQLRRGELDVHLRR
jgi:hypothetical protein